MSQPNLQFQIRKLRNLRLTIDALELTLPKAHQAFATFAPDGIGSGGSDGRSSEGEHSDPVGGTVTNFMDDGGLDERMTDIDMAIDGLCGTARIAFQDATKLAALTTDRAHEAPPGQGWCRAHCGHWCPGTVYVPDMTSSAGKLLRGTKDDRLRNGLCNPCRVYRDRNEIVDLADLQRRRRGNEGNCGCEDCDHVTVVNFQPKVVA